MQNIIDKAVRYKGISFHYIESPDMNGVKDIHPGVEVIWLIKGKATFMTEKLCIEVNDDTLIIIPPRTFHQFSCKKGSQFKYVTINMKEYSDERNYLLQGLDDAVVFSNRKIPYFETLKKITSVLCEEEETLEVRTYLHCTTMAMFAEMRIREDCFRQKELSGNHSALITDVLKYIEENMFAEITVNAIAEAMSVSTSTLFHSFKKEMGVSVYKYLMQKRLILASKLIDDGERPTEIYYKCGFKDYPNFFRAYRRMFGITPTGKVSNRKVPLKPVKPTKR